LELFPRVSSRPVPNFQGSLKSPGRPADPRQGRAAHRQRDKEPMALLVDAARQPERLDVPGEVLVQTPIARFGGQDAHREMVALREDPAVPSRRNTEIQVKIR
jgi:hypothetical protein